MNPETEALMRSAKRVVDDKGVFSDDQVLLLGAMLIAVEHAIYHATKPENIKP